MKIEIDNSIYTQRYAQDKKKINKQTKDYKPNKRNK